MIHKAPASPYMNPVFFQFQRFQNAETKCNKYKFYIFYQEQVRTVRT